MIVDKKFLKKNNIKWSLTKRVKKVGYQKKVWCICSCGHQQWVWLGNIKYLKSKSCKKCASTKHGGSYTRLNNIWNGMKYRCSPTKGHKDYGKRGISVCEKWSNSFEQFRRWAYNNGYNDNLTIERKNVNGNYEPKNCKWIPLSEQANNKRSNIVVDGKNLSQWSKELGLSQRTLGYRKDREGLVRNILRPLRKEKSKYPGVSFDDSNNNKKPWRCRAGHKGKVYSVGRFKTELQAAKAYRKCKKIISKKKLIKRY